MDRETTAMFIGHRDCVGLDITDVRAEIAKLVECGVTDFLCGGMGAFDYLCAAAVYQQKRKHPRIKSHAIIPYLTRDVQAKEFFDSIVYPDGLEKYHHRYAITARDRWMVENSAYALCYINHDWGGAAKTYRRAMKEGLFIINIGEGF